MRGHASPPLPRGDADASDHISSLRLSAARSDRNPPTLTDRARAALRIAPACARSLGRERAGRDVGPEWDHGLVAIAAFLDESHRDKHHPILSVGGFVCDLADVPALESEWMNAKGALGLPSNKPIRYAMSWPDKAARLRLIERIPRLGVRVSAVAALLEDFRPKHYSMRREKRKDMYVQRRAFQYVLQRLPEPQYLPPGASGPHLVFADRHDDFRCYDEEYATAWADGWHFASSGRRVPPLREVGFVAAASSMSAGPTMEIADLIGSVAVRWAESMVARKGGKSVPDARELDTAMYALLALFPARPSMPPSWRGYSLIAHRGRLTGNEVLYDRIDGWLYDLFASGGDLAA